MKRLILACLVFWPAGQVYAASPMEIGLNLSIACPSGRPMSIVSTIPKPVYGEVISFVSKADAEQRLSNTEMRSGETINPAYANDQRVILQWRVKKGTYERIYVAVPPDMTVHVGEDVAFVAAHGDPNNFCQFIPNLIVQ